MSALDDAVTAMAAGSLFDVTIICTTDDFQAEYWMNRLSNGICKDSRMVLACSEDWGPGGAGNGLGTLYAYLKACKLAKTKYDVDLAQLLASKEVSAALFHTAGKGTRMAPLPASENNNKPGVKLPVVYTKADGTPTPMTVLEAVIKQTGVYAASRKGRLSVFWGDQVFIPSAPFVYEPTHHADIMCTLLGETAPTAEEWAAQGLEKYGVIAVLKGDARNAAQVEKVNHATAVKMLGTLGDIGQVGPSLGSFSVSATLLTGLCEEFKTELLEKTEKLDTDPHFWMPLTLPKSEYASLMSQKGIDTNVSDAHHDRMSAFKDKLDLGSLGLFGAVDVGSKACWWDYGMLKLYSKNNLKLLEDDGDAMLLRKFMGVTDRKAYSNLGETTVDEISTILKCSISSGSVTSSVLASVTTKEISSDGAIIVNCVAPKITAGKGCILYNLISEEEIVAADGAVMVAVTEESGDSMVLKSAIDIDGGTNWKVKLGMNEMTFEDVFKKNQDANIGTIEGKREEQYTKVAESLGL